MKCLILLLQEIEPNYKPHYNLNWTSDPLKARLDFVWAPEVNESMHKEIDAINR